MIKNTLLMGTMNEISKNNMETTTVTKSNQITDMPIADHKLKRLTKSEEITISFYENQIPPFVEAEMERLYENIYTSLSRFRIYGEMENASTYVVRKGDKVITLFLFRREQDEVKVLNKQITIDEAEILRFTNATFAAFKSVKIISFLAIQTAMYRCPFPYQQCHFLEDIVVTLPATVEEYFSNLGKHMRRDVKYYRKKIERNFPSFHFQIYVKEEIKEQHIRDIIRLSGARMAVKNKAAYIHDEETERILRLVKMYGFVGVITIDGHICSGGISYCIGSRYFMHVVAHDPAYDNYRLGTLCNYLTICECIARGGTECRFMASSHQYKFDFLGVRIGFDYLAIYRSRAQFLLNSGKVIKIAGKTQSRR